MSLKDSPNGTLEKVQETFDFYNSTHLFNQPAVFNIYTLAR